MDDVFLMHVLETGNKASHKEPGCLFIKATVLADVVAQITTRKVIHYQVEVFTVLECVVHIDDEEVVQLFKNLAFVDHGLNAALGNYASFGHFFHCVVLLLFLSLNSPDLPKSALTNAEVVDEVSFGYSY